MAASLTRYYRVLGLPATASAKEIKSAYIDLCKRCHPDILQTSDPKEVENNKLKFQEIQEAYSQLINKDGSKNIAAEGETMSRRSRRARGSDWAGPAGFPNQYETFRERSFHHENPYMHRQYRGANNSENKFNFEDYYRKKYGRDYETYRQWSEQTRQANAKESPFDTSDEEFWRRRQWDEYRGYYKKQSVFERGLPKERIAVICLMAFITSNLLFYILAVPSDSSRRPKSHWGQLD